MKAHSIKEGVEEKPKVELYQEHQIDLVITSLKDLHAKFSIA